MNREILFRGKRVDNNEWVYGQIVFKKCYRDNGGIEHYLREWIEEYAFIYEDNIENNCEEYPTKFIEVIPETIGQYTGLEDKNGKKIFEGDIVKYGGEDTSYVVMFDPTGYWCLDGNGARNSEMLYYEDVFKYLEVIGNIYENEVD